METLRVCTAHPEILCEDNVIGKLREWHHSGKWRPPARRGAIFLTRRPQVSPPSLFAPTTLQSHMASHTCTHTGAHSIRVNVLQPTFSFSRKISYSLYPQSVSYTPALLHYIFRFAEHGLASFPELKDL